MLKIYLLNLVILCFSLISSAVTLVPKPVVSQNSLISGPIQFQRYTPNNLKDFSEQHYNVLKKYSFSRLKPLSFYKNTQLKWSTEDYKGIQDHLEKNLADFRSLKPVLSRSDKIDFYSVNRNKNKTILFIPMAHVSPLYALKMFNTMVAQGSDYNFVFSDLFRIFSEEKAYSAAEVENLIQSEVADFIKKNKDQKFYLEVICFSFQLVNQFLNNNHQDYAAVNLFAPMVFDRVKGHQISPDLLYPDAQTWMPYADLLSLLFMLTEQPQPFLIPEQNAKFNLKTFNNLFASYSKGRQATKIKNGQIILGSEDLIVPEENTRFLKSVPLKIIKRANHLTPFYNKEHLNEFVNLSLEHFKKY